MPLARLSRALGRFATRRPWLALVGGIVACALMALPALGMRLDTDFLSLLPRNEPAVRDFVDLARTFGSTDTLLAVVEVAADGEPAPAERERARTLIGRLADDITALRWAPADGGDVPMIATLEGRPDPAVAQAFEDVLIANTWLFLDDAGVDQVARRLQAPLVERMLAAGPGAQTPPRLTGRDAARLWTSVYLPHWSRGPAAAPGGLERGGGFLSAEDGRLHVLVMHAARPAQEREFAFALVRELDAIAKRHAADPANAGMDIRMVGGHFIAAADFRIARDSSWQNLTTGLLGVLALFLVVYRSPKLILLIACSVLPAVFAAVGLSRFILGTELSLVATSFAAIVLGVGLDFVIHLYNGYGWAMQRRARRWAEHPSPVRRRIARAASARHSLECLMPSILAGCLTTVLAFAVLALSDFRGLVELGVLAAIGLTVILVQLMIALPAFLALFGPRSVRHTAALAGFGGAIARRPWPYAGAIALLVCAALVVIARAPGVFPFDPDPRSLRPKRDPAFDAQSEMVRRLGLGGDRFKVLVRSRDDRAALAAAARVVERARVLAQRADVRATAAFTPAAAPAMPGDLAVDGLPAEVVALGGPRVFDSPLGVLRAESLAAGRLIGVRVLVPGAAAALAVGDALTLRPAARATVPVPAIIDPARQVAVMDRLATAIDWSALDAVAAAQDEHARRRYAAFWSDLAAMRARIEARRPLAPDELAASGLAPLVSGLWRRDGEGGGWLQLGVSVPDLAAGWLGAADVQRLLALPDSGAGATAVASGMPVLTAVLQEVMVADFLWLGLLALVMVVVLLALLMRTPGDAALALATLACGVAVMLAVMHLAGLRWNLMNLAVMPLVLGIGIDNAIYFINALRRHRHGPAGVVAAMAEVGYPMLMTTAASVIGFGSLIVSPYRGLQSLGLVASVGLIACLAVSMIGLPAIARLTSHRRP
ncbi:MAG TPA: MMPL family transporter [Planctomycetota bacterium]|nr:MMPL family transporter [Planctomycetota bacterium]